MLQWDCGIPCLPGMGIGDNAVVRRGHQLGPGHQEKKTLRILWPGAYLRFAYCVQPNLKRLV
jgi:hypothetical protein